MSTHRERMSILHERIHSNMNTGDDMTRLHMSIGLIEGRHPMPVDYYIFKKEEGEEYRNIDYPLDIDALYKEATQSFINAICDYENEVEYRCECPIANGANCWTEVYGYEVHLYMTGLGTARNAALAAWEKWAAANSSAELYLMEFDNETGQYTKTHWVTRRRETPTYWPGIHALIVKPLSSMEEE